ncbi:MAG: hypothetical protein RIC35_20120 [Marinoscillum sp.]
MLILIDFTIRSSHVKDWGLGIELIWDCGLRDFGLEGLGIELIWDCGLEGFSFQYEEVML